MDNKPIILPQLSKKQNIVMIIKGKDYSRVLTDLHKKISKKFERICVVTVSKPYNILIKQLQDEGIDHTKYCFIDCSSKKEEVKEPPLCDSISSPQSLTQIAIAISKTIKNKHIDLIMLDSISALLLYNDELSVTKSLNNIMASLRKNHTKGIYILLREDLKGFLKSIFLSADEVIEV